MKKIIFLLSFQAFFLLIFAQTNAQEPGIIPEPVTIVKNTGHFTLPKNLVLETGNDPSAKNIAAMLARQLSVSAGYIVTQSSKADAANAIRLLLNTTADKTLADEGYLLTVAPAGIVIKANKPAGLFYGVQTLLQLLPKEVEAKSEMKHADWEVPCVTITDYPRFAWRGLMFDVARHFFSKKDVKEFIDNMVKYKYNLLHMHLTDDEGWRIEIKGLPKLTEVGAWNVRRIGTFGEFSVPTRDEPRDFGGFYTQEDMKEIIQYAKERFVNILPEVDVPGHSMAAVVSYPDLSCTAGSENYQVISGEKFMIWPEKGHFYGLQDNTLCPANEKVYVFLDKVFTELAKLFPFEYIHVGGDECARNFWEKSDAIKALMQKEKLKNLDEVQSYFEKRVEKIVESKGKKMIGWDEILEGGLAANATVMSWRGIKGGVDAAKLGHQVVMSPTTFTYIDYMQSDRLIEPPVYATLRLKTTYAFEPVPEGVDPKFIKGGQANLWTEQVYNTRHMQYLLWPRSLAIAECLWSPKEKKNWDGFTKKVESIFDRMDVEQVKYARSMFDPIFFAKKDDKDSLQVELSTEVAGLHIYYSFDNSNPDQFYPEYTTALSIPKDASMLKVVTYRDDKPMGKQIDMPISELHKRADRKSNE
jgi:hexosaminidase